MDKLDMTNKPFISDMIKATEDTIMDVIHNVNSLDGFELPPLGSIVRSKLLCCGALSKYTENPAAIQSIINRAQFNILKDPLNGYDFIQSMVYGTVQYNPTILYSLKYGDMKLGDIVGAWNTDLREDIVRECLNQLIDMGDTDYIINNIFLGRENSLQDVMSTAALWLAIKGSQSGDIDESYYQYDIPNNVGVSLLANRSEYFFYPGAKEDLIEIYDKALSKAVELVCSNDVNMMSDLQTTIMYYIYRDVSSVFEEYGDKNNLLGIDQVTANLSELVSNRISDAIIQCIWDNLEFLVNASRGTGSASERMLERILITYISCAME